MEGRYYGITPGLHETVFIKTNRELRTKEIEVYSYIAGKQANEGIFNGAKFDHLL
jgi:hypothetical protein